jgi:DNA-binding NtrC family response regulator
VASDDTDEVTAAPAIVMVASGMSPTSLVLPSTATLGRTITAAGATYEVADERMSRDHASVRWDRGTWMVNDLDSRNGTFVNGERIAGEVKRRGDVIVRVGHTVFVLLADGRGHPASEGPAVVGPELGGVYEQMRRFAVAGSGLLLVQGAPGSGKQLAARTFHEAGPRAAGPFVTLSCGAIHGVAERLLFGGKKGVVETIGHLQMARGGTLYLAEIGELDPAAQAGLIKLLEARAATGAVDCGIVCGGYELRTAVVDGLLREELFDRLATAAIMVPPLRARRVDLARLMQLEVNDVSAQHQLSMKLHPKLMEACLLRPWPGNVRELRAAIRHAATRAIADHRDILKADDLLDTAGLPPGATSAETAVERKGPQELGRASLIEAMSRANNVVTAAARSLRIHRSQLTKLLEEHAIAFDDQAHDE